MTKRKEEAANLQLLLDSRNEDDLLLGLHLAAAHKISLDDLTNLCAIALFHSHQELRDLAMEGLAMQAHPREMEFIRVNWEPTYTGGNPAYFFDAVARIGEIRRINKDELLRRAVRMTRLFPEGRAHRYPAAFIEFCELEVEADKDGSLILDNHRIPYLPPEMAGSGRLREINLLSLKNCSLRRLPREIAAFSRLTDLYIGQNPIRSLPPGFAELQELSRVDWNGSPLRGAPEVIPQLPNLWYLRLVLEKGRDYSALGRCKNLFRLELVARKGVLPLPEAMFELDKVKELRFEQKNWEFELPERFSGWKKLRHVDLDLSGNHPFPAFVMQLPELDFLQVSRVGAFPYHTDIQPQPHLRHLRLRDCSWEEWPEAWSVFPGLRVLEIQGGNLQCFPGSFGGSGTLEEVSFKHLPLQELPAFIFDHKGIRSLALHHLKIRELPRELLQLQNLDTLRISSCPIRQLPDFLPLLPRLKAIHLEGLQLNKQEVKALAAAMPQCAIHWGG